MTIGGYFVYGEFVTANLILSLGHTSLVSISNVLMAIHLVFAFLIVINPVSQEIEEFFRVPHGEFEFSSIFSFYRFINYGTLNWMLFFQNSD